MINLPLNFSAPTGQVQNTYAQPTRTNPYLTSSQYSDMQQHTPSGYYYQGGKFYEPYTPEPVTYRFGGYDPLGLRGGMNNFSIGYDPLGFRGGMNNNIASGGPVANSIKTGSQYFKPFTGNAQGIINGNLSMAAMSGQNNYQPQGIPNNLLNFLSTPSMQQTNNQQSSGAGRFAGLLGSPITTNAQGK